MNATLSRLQRRKPKLSVVMITDNSESLLKESLASVRRIADEIVIIDSQSQDKTLDIAKKFRARIFQSNEQDLGKKKNEAIAKTKNEWVLILDSDEIISLRLSAEILQFIQLDTYDVGYIPFQNHYLGKKLTHGGEDYIMPRIFKKSKVKMKSALVHEQISFKTKKKITLNSKIYHYSYRSIPQMYRKFTEYAIREAKERKRNGQTTSMWKVLTYPPHMFWARFIKDKGYVDGIWRAPLDLGFAYMEFLTYISMPFVKV